MDSQALAVGANEGDRQVSHKTMLEIDEQIQNVCCRIFNDLAR